MNLCNDKEQIVHPYNNLYGAYLISETKVDSGV